MYIAMNRFKIVLGREIEFENIWRQRDTHLKDVPGFEKFQTKTRTFKADK